MWHHVANSSSAAANEHCIFVTLKSDSQINTQSKYIHTPLKVYDIHVAFLHSISSLGAAAHIRFTYFNLPRFAGVYSKVRIWIHVQSQVGAQSLVPFHFK